MTLQELRYAVALARERHFGRAAAACFVSQPSLSTAIRHLEDELGVTLFERTRGEIVITDIGRQVLAQAERTLEEAARVKHVAAAGKDQLRGALKLGVIHTIAPYLLPELVIALRQRARDMPLDIEENMTENLDRMLREGAIDVAILALPFEAPGIKVLPVYDELFGIAVPTNHPWTKRKRVPAAELSDEHLLLLSVGHCFRDQVLEACARFTRPGESGKQGNSLETLRSMVASGLGVTVLPATAFGAKYASPLVKQVSFAAPVPRRRVVLATRQDFYRPRAIELLAAVLHGLPLPIEPV
jgi:LysR family hydrogen peroxide-inducible transcriptional activator